jgi:hypothetical protein
VAVRFIGGGNQITRRKPLTCRKSLENVWSPKQRNAFDEKCAVSALDRSLPKIHLLADFYICKGVLFENSKYIADCIGSCNSNYHMITTTTAPSVEG